MIIRGYRFNGQSAAGIFYSNFDLDAAFDRNSSRPVLTISRSMPWQSETSE